MRRVYDDEKYYDIALQIMKIVDNINPKNVSEYDYGMYRARPHKVKEYIYRNMYGAISFGNNTHAHGIGNNNTIEIICKANENEEQICGLLHLTNDMFGGCIVWVSDIDGKRTTHSRKIVGRED